MTGTPARLKTTEFAVVRPRPPVGAAVVRRDGQLRRVQQYAVTDRVDSSSARGRVQQLLSSRCPAGQRLGQQRQPRRGGVRDGPEQQRAQSGGRLPRLAQQRDDATVLALRVLERGQKRQRRTLASRAD